MSQSQERCLELADRYWDEILEIEPLLGTEVGDERFDDRLPDPTEAGLARREEVHRRALEDAAKIDRSQLDLNGRTSLDIVEAIARRWLDAVEFRIDRFEAVTHLWGPGNLLADLASLQRADTPERLERYLRRLAAVPQFLAGVEWAAEDGVRAGQTAPGMIVDRSIAQVERFLAIDPTDSPALMPIAEDETEGRERALRLLRDEVLPAYARYRDALRRYRPSARETLGIYAVPRGEEMYASLIRAWTTLPLDAKRVHEIGLDDLAKIQDERRQSAERLGFRDADAAIGEHQASGRNTASSREEIVRLAEEQVRRGWGAAPRWFGRMPNANCEVRAVEEFREKDMPFAWYNSPTEDGSRPGIYWVNTSDLDQRPLHHVAATTYHEANPGHHFQVSIEQEIKGRPKLRRFAGLLAGSAFTEGWGLYSERLADEMGLYVDEYERLGMLDAQGMRAARLVVDTGIHAFAWDRDRAIATMEEAGVSHVDAVVEVDRYISLPGQALAYKVGQFEIERWRREAAEREGDAFSLRDFHDRLLGLGSLPLEALEREIGAGASE